MSYIYKVTSKAQWQLAESVGYFAGSGIDLTDGFIHLSSAAQLIETVTKYFAGQQDLVIVVVDTEKLGDALRWEPSRGGALFPHLYGVLPTSAVVECLDLPVDEFGAHWFPPGPWNC